MSNVIFLVLSHVQLFFWSPSLSVSGLNEEKKLNNYQESFIGVLVSFPFYIVWNLGLFMKFPGTNPISFQPLLWNMYTQKEIISNLPHIVTITIYCLTVEKTNILECVSKFWLGASTFVILLNLDKVWRAFRQNISCWAQATNMQCEIVLKKSSDM